jgi:hypothetical protein
MAQRLKTLIYQVRDALRRKRYFTRTETSYTNFTCWCRVFPIRIDKWVFLGSTLRSAPAHT